MNVITIALLEDAWSGRNNNRPAARAASERVLADIESEPRIAALAKTVLSYLEYRERRYDQAVAAGFAALAVLGVDPNDIWLPRLYNTLAIIHLDLGERDKSRVYLDKQIRLSYALGDQTYEALGYHDLGVLQAVADRQMGLESLAQARMMFHASGDAENQALAIYNIANIHRGAGEHAAAVDYAQQALKLLHTDQLQGMGFSIVIHISTLMAESVCALGQYSEAQRLLDDTQALVARHAPELLPHVYFCQGLYFVAVGSDDDALIQFQETLQLLEPTGQLELLSDCHAALTDCSERLGDYRAALSHHRRYVALRERIFSETNQQKMRALDVIHQVQVARQTAEAERKRSAELQHYIAELEQLQATLQAISVRDALTNLYNRRYLSDEGERLLRYAQRHQIELCVAMIDLDNFKRVNDGLGHYIGDMVLQKVAAILSEAARITDLITRYGGEEIAMLLPSTSMHDAYTVCERLRSAIEQYDWAGIHANLRVTISIGLVMDDGRTLIELLNLADVQLYRSKSSGRNRTSYDQADMRS